MLSNKAYDILKDIALVMPVLTTFVEAIMAIWKIPYAVQVGLTMTAINALIGGLVKAFNSAYKKKLALEEAKSKKKGK